MNIHEYQAKELLRSYGVPVSKGIPAFTVDEAVKAAEPAASKTCFALVFFAAASVIRLIS